MPVQSPDRSPEAFVNEKRRHERVALDLPLICETGAAPIIGTAADISVGGMYVQSETAPAFGSNITIVMELSGASGTVRLPGAVRWVKPGGFGVQFGLLGARETHTIAQLMKR